MKKNIKKIFVFIILIISCYLVNVKADNLTPSLDDINNRHEYVIDKYNININVNENNTFDITEEITAHFNIPKHGIIRKIPLKNTVERLDDSTSINYAQITNVSVDNEYTNSIENSNYQLIIGSKDKTITGNQKYIIKYTYNIGKDPLKDIDEFYYNIIGDDWDTVIGNITFKITMPKEFDSSKLGFSSGYIGSTDSSKVIYQIDGNIISGRYNGVLGIYEAITVRLELPEGYFVGAGRDKTILDYLMYIVPIFFLIVSVFLWYKFGRDDKIVETVEFYPPEGLNSLDVGLIYKGKADKKDITSLLIYLANKGYIKIKKYGTDGFKIIKLKDYFGKDLNEHMFFNGLFMNYQKDFFKKVKKRLKQNQKKGKETSYYDVYNQNLSTKYTSRKTATLSNLYKDFNKTTKAILSNVNNWKNKTKYFEEKSLKCSFVILGLIIICFLAIFIIQNYGYYSIRELIVLLFEEILVILLFLLALRLVLKNTTPIELRIIVFFILISLLYDSFKDSTFNFSNDPYSISSSVGDLCLGIMILLFKITPKRTKYGNEIFGKIKGFKRFLKTAEKDRLEAMVNDNPTYFYDILPYTYVLGISNKWIKKFETITMQAPSWYDGYDSFDVSSFGSFINSTMSSAQSAVSPSSSSDFSDSSSGGSSGGGGSGGGSSGGGSGGGGGSSW